MYNIAVGNLSTNTSDTSSFLTQQQEKAQDSERFRSLLRGLQKLKRNNKLKAALACWTVLCEQGQQGLLCLSGYSLQLY